MSIDEKKHRTTDFIVSYIQSIYFYLCIVLQPDVALGLRLNYLAIEMSGPDHIS